MDRRKKKEDDQVDYGTLLKQYVSDVNQQEQLRREAHKHEFFEENFGAGYLDYLFFTGQTVRLDDQTEVNTTLKYHIRQKIYLIWMHHHRFRDLFDKEEIAHRDECEHKQFTHNVALKALSFFLLINLKLWKRPAGRPWTYDVMLGYGGFYSLVCSTFLGVKNVYDQKLDLMSQKIIANRRRVPPENIFNGTGLEWWKVYIYKFDSLVASIF